jgi:hypothetical protein
MVDRCINCKLMRCEQYHNLLHSFPIDFLEARAVACPHMVHDLKPCVAACDYMQLGGKWLLKSLHSTRAQEANYKLKQGQQAQGPESAKINPEQAPK